jgi:hypothetical protein
MHRAMLGCLLAVALLAPRPAAAEDTDTEAARIHYKAGEQYYLRGLYAQAIAEFNEAYRLSKAAALLYNISQAYERAGDLPAARDHLARYIDSGQTEPGEMQALREKLASLDRRIAEKASPPPAPVAPPPVVDRGPSRPLRTWKWVAGGVGVGATAVAVLFALDAKKQERDLEDWLAANPSMKFEPGVEGYEIYQKGKRDNAMTAVFGLSGLALLATSTAMFIVDAGAGDASPGPGEERAIVPLISPTVVGAAAAWRW